MGEPSPRHFIRRRLPRVRSRATAAEEEGRGADGGTVVRNMVGVGTPTAEKGKAGVTEGCLGAGTVGTSDVDNAATLVVRETGATTTTTTTMLPASAAGSTDEAAAVREEPPPTTPPTWAGRATRAAQRAAMGTTVGARALILKVATHGHTFGWYVVRGPTSG